MGCGASRNPQATQPPNANTAVAPVQGLRPVREVSIKQPPADRPIRPMQPVPETEDQEMFYDPDLDLELNIVKLDKRGRPVAGTIKHPEPVADPTNAGLFFQLENEETGDNALAVKPWIGAMKAPSNPPKLKNGAPLATLELEYIYGYRCVDSRQNVYYTTAPNEVAYMCGAVGVVLNTQNNTQRFFGAGDVKTVTGHDDDVTALSIHPEKDIIATGQLGKNPKICVWQASDMVMLAHFFQGRDTRAVTAIGFSKDGSFLAAADNSDNHNVRVFDWRKGTCLHVNKGGPDKILDLSWSTRTDMFCTVGVKHICFWALEPFKSDRGIFGQGNPACDMLCVRWLPNGYCLTGGTTGALYLWPGKSLSKLYQTHGRGAAVHSLAIVGEKVISGGKDNKIVVQTTAFQQLHVYEVESCPRALDMLGDRILCGMRNGTIIELDQAGKVTTLMESHSDGEVWGLCLDPQRPEIVVSTCDDNKIKVWDIEQRRCVATGVIEQQPGQPRQVGVGASTHSRMPPNQQSRAVAVSPSGQVAVAHNDGHVTIRPSLEALNMVFATLKDPKEWTESMCYSPDGTYLAVGSHDNYIYVYDTTGKYRLKHRLRGHSSFIIALDWSVDGHYLHSNCGAYELLFWDVDSGKQLPSGGTALRDEEWATWTAKLGWPVQGVYDGVVDMTHVNGVDRSHDKKLFAIGNDYGLVELFNNPNGPGAKSNAYQAHCEFVTNVKWTSDDQKVISAGGYDMCVMQWTRK